ncbi:membrane dipeptidase [Fonticula alba]|uniref:Dipeptidase n=1 Tax=Fonticula alba TaxID=691883 RepID=A0A058ZGD5_FONAL|nr:membrane dipeptidase [Fonticula alba]KCV72973.1 membrane dipeptidase [Fonticula alba]|eukprot:XP_009492674.1 membrane dipeptidase [Fonticula alba]
MNVCHIPRLRAGGVGGQFWSVYVPCKANYKEWSDDVLQTLEQIDLSRRMISHYDDTFAYAITANDIRKALSEGKIASLLGIEGGHQIDGSLYALRAMYDLGVRYMTLSHNCNTAWIDSATTTPEHNGLTEFGETVVREMNRLGMLIDLSHVSAKAMADVLSVTQAPVIFSHSSAFSVCDHARNVPDHLLRQVATNKGIVMVNFASKFICCAETSFNCTSVDVADHVDQIVRVAGIDHVGLGGDYDGVPFLPSDMQDVSTYPVLFAELMSRGYSDEDLIKLSNANIIRVLEDVERVAARIQMSGVLPDETKQPHFEKENPPAAVDAEF